MTDNSSNLRDIPISAIAGAFVGSAPTNAHDGLRWLLRFVVLTTSAIARKVKTGRITALK